MAESAVLVSQSGELTLGLEAIVSAKAYDHVTTLITDRQTDNRYYLSPATVEAIEERQADSPASDTTVVVDGNLHPGQSVDLQRRLAPMAVRDRRGAVWEWLAESNPVAATCFDIYQARIARREAASEQRDAATSGPSGTSGRLAADDEHLQRLQASLADQQTTARQRVQTGYEGVDGRVVLLGRVAAPTTALWSALTETTAAEGAGHPTQPTTATTTVGPHTLAVTDTPGIPGADGLPDWLLKAVPGLSAALEQATCVLGPGDDCESLLTAVSAEFDAHCRSLPTATARAARETLHDVLETRSFAVRLPYNDDAHAFVSELHEEGVVQDTEYDDAIYLQVEVPETAAGDLRRRVEATDGELRPYNTSE